MDIADPPEGKRVALIAGPTASGKSQLAVAFARALADRGERAVVVNADSAQVYADLAILSARPTVAEMQGVPHALFGAWDGAVACSAADWAAAARAVIARAHADGAVPILVGGSGLYLRTLLDGIAPVPPIDPLIRARVRALDPEAAWMALQQEDPAAAVRLVRGDRQRIARALEVVRSTGLPLAHWQAQREGGIGREIALAPIILLPDRARLYARCEARFAAMMAAGALEEVRRLLARRLPQELPVMRAIGVPELAACVRGEWSLAQAMAAAIRATRNYAKRQYTWLRHQPPGDWPRVTPENFTDGELYAILFRKWRLT